MRRGFCDQAPKESDHVLIKRMDVAEPNLGTNMVEEVQEVGVDGDRRRLVPDRGRNVQGASYLAHAGALVTVIGIVLTFAATPERQRIERERARLRRISDAGMMIALGALESDAAPGDRIDRAAIERKLRSEIEEGEADIVRSHEFGLVIAEASLLVLGTLTWGFADLLPW